MEEYKRHKAWKSFKRRKASFQEHSWFYRQGVVIIGFVLVIGGVAIGPLPGPGPVILVPLGLSLLALRFSWAEKALARCLTYFIKAQKRSEEASSLQRGVAGLILLTLAIGGVGFGAYVLYNQLA